MKTKPKLIGLTGTNGAGKGTAAGFFRQNGYAYFSLSDLIREGLAKRGQEATRDNLIKMGNHLRQSYGSDVLARRILKKIQRKSVIDSIRNPQEVELLRRQENFILLAIEAPVELRYERVKKRGRNESASSLQEFRRKEAEEMTGQERGQQLQTCLQMADQTIINDGSLEAFYQKLEAFI